MSAQSLTLTSNTVENLEQQVKQVVVKIRSLTNNEQNSTESLDGSVMAAVPSTVMCPW